jgi:alanyl-tRNA synthetase
MGLASTHESYSTELCGGTHVRRTGDIGMLKIVSESALAAGVRRIEALTGPAALAHVSEQETLLKSAAHMLNTAPADVPGRIGQMLEDRRRLERELSEARRAIAAGGGRGPSVKDVGNIRFSPRLLEGIPARELKSLADDLKKQLGSGVVALIATSDGKASVVVGITNDLVGRLNAVDLVKVGATALGGSGGGGRPDMAQAGGPHADQAQAALDAIEKALSAAA